MAVILQLACRNADSEMRGVGKLWNHVFFAYVWMDLPMAPTVSTREFFYVAASFQAKSSFR
jgi:hypothetical protein